MKMKEKEKGKFNPFIKELHPDEEILWLSAHAPLSFRAHLTHNIVKSLRSILLLILGLAVILFLIGDERLLSGAGTSVSVILFRYVSTSFAIIVPLSCFLFVILYPFMWLADTRVLGKAYAVTNQRLLSYSRGRVSERALEEIGVLKKHKRAISFGPSFPNWNDLEEPAEVINLIEQAQKDLRWHDKSKRLQETVEEDRIDFEDEDLLKQTEVR